MKLRHELKYQINRFDGQILRARLQAALGRDVHAGEDGKYKIRSLYFDTPNDLALFEKNTGADPREKFRIRRYPGSASGRISLEKKIKTRGLCGKLSALLTRTECEKIIKGDIEWMPWDSRELIAEFYFKMKSRLLCPKTIVEYDREPFVYKAGNVRITLDSDIRTGLFSKDLLNDDQPLFAAGDGVTILEVKYDEFIPSFITDMIQIGNRRTGAWSKYAIGRQYG